MYDFVFESLSQGFEKWGKLTGTSMFWVGPPRDTPVEPQERAPLGASFGALLLATKHLRLRHLRQTDQRTTAARSILRLSVSQCSAAVVRSTLNKDYSTKQDYSKQSVLGDATVVIKSYKLYSA